MTVPWWRRGVAAALLALSGCGRGEVALTPVQGQVFYRGKPLSGGVVVFTPDAQRGGTGPLAVGVLDAQGRYRLLSDGRPGAVAGWHRISVAAAVPADGGPAAVDLPDHFRDPDRSGQSREIKAGETNTVDLRLE